MKYKIEIVVVGKKPPINKLGMAKDAAEEAVIETIREYAQFINSKTIKLED
jgi:hypothetical protein